MPSPDTIAGAARNYDAFLSYSHRVDREFARTFQSDLERFGGRFPWSRTLQIYRDETNLAATPDLWATIEDALDRSRRLILFASPGSAGSAWVPREVGRFTAQHGAAAMCIVLTLGKTEFTDAGDIDDADRALATDTLGLLGDAIPLVVDMRQFRAAPRRARRSHEYVNAVTTVVSFISGRDKDVLFSEHLTRRRWWTRVLAVIAVTMSLLAIVAILQTAAEHAATERALQGEAAARRAQLRAERLGNISDRELRAAEAREKARDEPEEALTLALRSWRAISPPWPPDATVDDLEHRARVSAAATLATVLETHPGLVGSLPGRWEYATALSIADSGVVTLVSRGQVLEWDLPSRSPRPVHPPLGDPEWSPSAAVLDGTIAMSSTKEVVIRADDRTTVLPMTDAYSVAICRGGDRVLLSSRRKAWLYQRSTGISTPIGDGEVLACSPDGTRVYLATASQIETADLSTGERRLLAHFDQAADIGAVAISDDGTRIAAAVSTGWRGAGAIWVWSATGDFVARWPTSSTVADIAFVPHDGARLYTGGLIDGMLTTWKVGVPVPIDSRYVHRGGVWKIAVDPRSGRIVTAGADYRLRIWLPDSVDPLAAVIAGSAGYGKIARFDRGQIAALGLKTLRRWAPDLQSWRDIDAVDEGLIGAALGPGGISVRVRSAGQRNVSVLFPDTGDKLEWESHYVIEDGSVVSPDGRLLAVRPMMPQEGLPIWQLAARGTQPIDLWPTSSVTAVAFDRASDWLAAGTADGELAIWSTSTLQRLTGTRVPKDSITALALSDRAARIAFGTLHGKIEVRSLKAIDQPGVTFGLSGKSPTALAFHPTLDWLAAVDDDGHVALFDVETGAPVARLRDSPAVGRLSAGLWFDEAGQLLIARGDALVMSRLDPDAWAAIADRVLGSTVVGTTRPGAPR